MLVGAAVLRSNNRYTDSYLQKILLDHALNELRPKRHDHRGEEEDEDLNDEH
jgi:hypothetical protein